MQALRNQAFRLTLAATFVGILASPSYAYLDPGTGSVVLQVLLGGAAGLALAGKLYWQKLLSLIGVRREAEESAQPDVDAGRK